MCWVPKIWFSGTQNLSEKYAEHKHSSEIRGLCLMKCSCETLQNLLYFWNTKTTLFFFIYNFMLTLLFSLMNALFYNLYWHRPGNSLLRGKNGVIWKKKLKLHGFSYSINMANFEASHWNISSNINLLFLKSEQWARCKYSA